MENIIQLDHLTLALKRVTNYNQDHQDGYSAIPHLCIKVKHGNGYAWIGLQVVQFKNVRWSAGMRDALREDIVIELGKMLDLVEVVSSLERIVESILDIVNEKKTSLLVSNITDNEDSLDAYILKSGRSETTDLRMSMNLANGVSLEVYKSEFDLNVMSYGGFALEVSLGNESFPAMLYHRSVILNNYINSDLVQTLVTRALNKYLPELAPVAKVINIVERSRRTISNDG